MDDNVPNNGENVEEEPTASTSQFYNEVYSEVPSPTPDEKTLGNAAQETRSKIDIDTFGVKFYEKTGGVQDDGKEFEKSMCILFALKLITDDRVVDFSMTSNNKVCGLIDDIELDVTFENQERRIFLLQLKYKEDKEPIDQNMFMKQTQKQSDKDQKSKFYLPKYLEAIAKLGIHQDQDVVNILYTNRPLKFQKNQKLMPFKSHCYELEVMKCDEITNRELLVSNPSREGIIVRFKPHVGTQYRDKEKLEKACEQFYILSEQDDLKTVEANIKEKLKTLLHCDVYSSFEHFMYNWWADNFVLTKHHVISKLAELALSPYIKTMSAQKHNEKTEKLKAEIMKFEMAIVEDSQEDIVSNIWTEINTDLKSSVLQKYEITKSGPSEVQKAKILWHSGKAPLIVKFNDSSEETIKAALDLLRKNNQMKCLILNGNPRKEGFKEWDVFENVSDLKKKHATGSNFSAFLRLFSMSFQDRGSITLERLSVIDEEFLKIIGITELLKMSQTECFLIGNNKVEFLPWHIPRFVSTYTITMDEMLKLHGNDNLIIINCTEDFKKKLQNINVMELYDYLNERHINEHRETILVSTGETCTSIQFEQICQKSKKSNVYVFQESNNESYFLVFIKGNKLSFFKNTNKKKYIEEQQILNHFDSPLHAVSALPGMGKSTLVKVLNNNCPSECWTVFIELIKYNSFLSKNPDYETIRSSFFEVDQVDELSRQVTNIWWKTKKIYLFLDGLDEVDSKYVDLVINFAKRISSEGVKVWLSSRENLSEKINQSLNVVPIEIKELDQEQQESYIQKALQVKYNEEELKEIVTAVYNSVDINNNRELLGIPLQLHLITEMFVTNEEVYTKLQHQNLFILTQMYKTFFEGKIKTVLKKLGIECSVSQLGIDFEEILEKYQLPALKSCLDNRDLEKLCVSIENSEKHLNNIMKEGDKYGLIKSVSNKYDAVFNHQTYAEYFACEWFRKHKDKIRLLIPNLFSSRYENLRRMFDIMMAENSPLHLAVIYENIEQFNKNIDDLKKTDEGGRTVLHLACCYGSRYSVRKSKYYRRESAFYVAAMEILLQNVNIAEKDSLLNFSCVNYANEMSCLYAIEKILEKELASFDSLELDKYYPNEHLAFRASQFGYCNLLSKVLEKQPNVMWPLRYDRNLLEIALVGLDNDDCTVPRHENIAAVRMLLSQRGKFYDRFDWMKSVCETRRYDMIPLLLENGVSCTNGNTILHYMLDTRSLDKDEQAEVITVAQTLNIDANAQNDEGSTPLHIATRRGHVDAVRILLNNGVDPNVIDTKERNALHYVFESRSSDNAMEMIRLLTASGINVNAQNNYGLTPFHLACRVEANVVKLLLEKSGNPYLKDNEMQTALHHVCKTYHADIETIRLLINLDKMDANARDESGATALHYLCKEGADDMTKLLLELLEKLDVNARDKSGSTALHYSCKRGLDKITKLLLDNGADPSFRDNKKNIALHYVCETDRLNLETIRLLMKPGIDVNAQNGDGATPLHLACM